ncbi:MAG: hypothetical protein CL759_12140 [Chloroflexi bacterium]|nr:hypothetical protein [Chloroflexota bacterium]
MSTKATYCPHCGEPVGESEDAFCKDCGSSLSTMETGINCHNCQRIIQDTDIYCPHCRHFTSFDA